MNAAITLDLDWAPDFVIDHAADQLLSRQVKATWFVTHDSPAVERLRCHPELFELGIHPNFLPGSTHGSDSAQVLRHCSALVPNARSVRTHGLVQTSNLLEQIVKETGITIDVSLFLPHAPNLQPVDYYWDDGVRMLRIPYFWEDDFEMVRPGPCWHVEGLLGCDTGVRIFDFHPIHIYLNSANLEPYRMLKRFGRLSEISEAQAESCVQTGTGTGSFFRELIAHLERHSSLTVSDIESKHLQGGKW